MINFMPEIKIQIRSVIRFFHLRGTAPPEIKRELYSVYGHNCISDDQIYYWISKFDSGTISVKDDKRSGRPRIEGLAEQIRAALENDRFQSARDLANLVGVDKNTIIRVLKDELSMVKVNLKWIPHQLTDALKSDRVAKARKMLEILKMPRRWGNIYTGDETWVYLRNPRHSMWILSGSQCPTRERTTIGAKKIMVTVIWSPTGMKSIVRLPSGQRFTKKFFVDVVIKDIKNYLRKHNPSHYHKGITLHIDNASSHRVDTELSAEGIDRMVHPPYSPDLAPSDFFLFGYLKTMLEGHFFESEDDLFNKVVEILRSIPTDTLKRVYYEWMNRLQKCIDSGGEYVE